MQIDMHYFGTYAMARAAGMSREHAQIAASAAQYVDDNVQDHPVVLKDGARLARTPTAHHLGDEIANIDPDDQRDVWVPFHFLPGNEASPTGDNDYTERLKCRKNSEPALVMIEEVVGRVALDPLGLERVGVTAHVFADTFSHYGFSGVSSRRNRVDGDSFRFQGLEPDMEKLLRNGHKSFLARFGHKLADVKSWVAETVTDGLGHGAVATYPDLPYLSWGFDYEFPTRIPENRNNRDSFLEACAALHHFFTRVVAQRGDFAEGTARPFASISDAVVEILSVKGDSGERAAAWQRAAQTGRLFTQAEHIPTYLGDEWTQWLEEADGKADSDEALKQPACRFHLAANAHRSWVLHELLPSRNLLVA
ncbi:MAG TPA: DUF6765 family protein [Magnetospirillum sp.]|jgi:hypothetical protein|nr:DUF6765 family protein [Magnetospirillum sp.]